MVIRQKFQNLISGGLIWNWRVAFLLLFFFLSFFKVNESQYIALFLVSGSAKKLFSIDFVNIYFSQYFFQQFFTNINVFSIFFPIVFTNSNIFSIFFSIVFANIYLFFNIFSIDFSLQKLCRVTPHYLCCDLLTLSYCSGKITNTLILTLGQKR